MKSFVESRDEMEGILRGSTYGFLGMSVADEPYVVPVNYAYVDGRTRFHCALDGKKIDNLVGNPRVSFTVAWQPEPVQRLGEGDACTMDCASVVCYGTARLIEDLDEWAEALNAFNRRFRPDAEDITRASLKRWTAVDIRVSEMTGRCQ